MRFLLDTHILLWALSTDELLPPRCASVLQDADNEVYFSVINLWEMVIKNALPRGGFTVDAVKARRMSLAAGFLELEVTAAHAFEVAALPLIHKDPFDRLLIAQARVERLELLTVDARMQRYLV